MIPVQAHFPHFSLNFYFTLRVVSNIGQCYDVVRKIQYFLMASSNFYIIFASIWLSILTYFKYSEFVQNRQAYQVILFIHPTFTQLICQKMYYITIQWYWNIIYCNRWFFSISPTPSALSTATFCLTFANSPLHFKGKYWLSSLLKSCSYCFL